MSDLTPEESRARAGVENPYLSMTPEQLGEDNNWPLRLAASAFDKGVAAAVAAERERIVKLLKSKAGTDAVANGTAGFYGSGYDRAFGSLAAKAAADLVAREGDTT